MLVGGKEKPPRPHPPEQKAGNELLKGLNQSKNMMRDMFSAFPSLWLKKTKQDPNTWYTYDSNPHENLI